MKKEEGEEDNGPRGGLSLFLFNRFNLFRFFYLDGKMWLFMLDMIKELNKQASAAWWEMWARLAEQSNITLTSACNAIWVGSCSYSFIYLVPGFVLVPGTTWITVPQAVNITNLLLWAGIWKNQERTLTTSKLSCDLDINKRGTALWNIKLVLYMEYSYANRTRHGLSYSAASLPFFMLETRALTFCWTVYLFKDNTTLWTLSSLKQS